MHSHRAVGALSFLIANVLLSACGDDDGGAPDLKDSGPEGGMPITTDSGTVADAAAPPFVPPTTQPDVSCGGTMCPALTATEVSAGVGNCCTDSDECGITTALTGATCLATGAPGGADPSCPDLIMETATPMAAATAASGGCCTPQGECGALVAGAGCIDNGTLMQPEQSCTYDAENMCTRILEVTCDGSEDCPDSQLCCGQYAGGYRRTTCADSCAPLETEQGGTWTQLCHPGDTCEDPDGMGFACLASAMLLPDFLYRCRAMGTEPGAAGNTAAGSVNCGLGPESADGTFSRQTCGDGEKCCISYPGQVARCAPAGETCPCDTGTSTPPDLDAGTEDAG